MLDEAIKANNELISDFETQRKEISKENNEKNEELKSQIQVNIHCQGSRLTKIIQRLELVVSNQKEKIAEDEASSKEVAKKTKNLQDAGKHYQQKTRTLEKEKADLIRNGFHSNTLYYRLRD